MLHVSVDEKPDEWLNNIFLLNTMGIKWFTYTYRIVVGTIFSLLSTFSDYTLKIDLWENVFPPKVFIDEQKHFFFHFLIKSKIGYRNEKSKFLEKVVKQDWLFPICMGCAHTAHTSIWHFYISDIFFIG